ncbi:MAG TPA: hypothetical protein VGI45_11505 [Terracidiphilus sp.]|jgi:hypothetical protein
MSDEKPRQGQVDEGPPSEARQPAAKWEPLPGLIAIAFYLLLLSVVIVIGVVGGHYPVVFIVLPVFLLAACGGLLVMLRWAWAMSLAAVLLLGGYNVWIFVRLHYGAALIQGLLNLVFFFYLVRTEVREKLR